MNNSSWGEEEESEESGLFSLCSAWGPGVHRCSAGVWVDLPKPVWSCSTETLSKTWKNYDRPQPDGTGFIYFSPSVFIVTVGGFEEPGLSCLRRCRIALYSNVGFLWSTVRAVCAWIMFLETILIPHRNFQQTVLKITIFLVWRAFKNINVLFLINRVFCVLEKFHGC